MIDCDIITNKEYCDVQNNLGKEKHNNINLNRISPDKISPDRISSDRISPDRISLDRAPLYRIFPDRIFPDIYDNSMEKYSPEKEDKIFYDIPRCSSKSREGIKSHVLSCKKSERPKILRIPEDKGEKATKAFSLCAENPSRDLVSELFNPLIYTPCDQKRESFLTSTHKSGCRENSIEYSRTFSFPERSNLFPTLPPRAKLECLSQDGLKFGGLFNFSLVMLFFTKFLDLLTSLSEHGIRPPQTVVFPTLLQMVYGIICVFFTSFLMFILEKLAFKNVISKSLVNFLESINITIALILPVNFVYYFNPNPFLSLVYITWSVMMVLKQISYILVMNEVRSILPKIGGKEKNISEKNLMIIRDKLKYPWKLVNIKNILYFYYLPILNYQLWYPRTTHIRWGVVGKLAAQFILCWSFFIFWTNQFVVPTMNKSGEVFKNGSFLEKLKLVVCVSSNYSITLPFFFYGTFHLLTNILAEILTFADREFYKDFWNCRTFGEFWIRWNLPVHHFCKRHIYYPFISMGIPKKIAVIMVFIISGIAHEYIFGLMFRSVGILSIVIMLVQPIIMLIEKKFFVCVDTKKKTFRGGFAASGICETFDLSRRYQINNLIFWIIPWFLVIPYAFCHYYANYLEQNG